MYIPSDAADSVIRVRQEGVNDAPALTTSCADDHNQLRHSSVEIDAEQIRSTDRNSDQFIDLRGLVIVRSSFSLRQVTDLIRKVNDQSIDTEI